MLGSCPWQQPSTNDRWELVDKQLAPHLQACTVPGLPKLPRGVKHLLPALALCAITPFIASCPSLPPFPTLQAGLPGIATYFNKLQLNPGLGETQEDRKLLNLLGWSQYLWMGGFYELIEIKHSQRCLAVCLFNKWGGKGGEGGKEPLFIQNSTPPHSPLLSKHKHQVMKQFLRCTQTMHITQPEVGAEVQAMCLVSASRTPCSLDQEN